MAALTCPHALASVRPQGERAGPSPGGAGGRAPDAEGPGLASLPIYGSLRRFLSTLACHLVFLIIPMAASRRQHATRATSRPMILEQLLFAVCDQK